ncbi:sugar transferase [Sphingomonas sp. BN140010]|uniref:Sugar transferase n=1 Tax=Sphingomonas arvum TaxID=2992113 RepID=A0ABT3JD69_9SPHN|nr:sugar transferase [Sphingomonas sp. BN140010]MCW3796981.1 sugar transferase [Sphingomonas sp. BN140010]
MLPPSPPVAREPEARRSDIGSAGLFRLVREEPLVELPAQLLPVAANGLYPLLVKRALDIVIASVALLLLWPVMVATALIIRLSGPGPIVFSHQRLGHGGKVFPCLKFRTMRQDADRVLQEVLSSSPELMEEWKARRKLRNDPRILPVGGVLRRYSLDELPQLFNVLRGDMSLIGPRPLATDEAGYYANSFPLYCMVKPGITGLWQVSGRNDVSYRQRVELDCQYVRTHCLRIDLLILLRTIPAIMGGTGY